MVKDMRQLEITLGKLIYYNGTLDKNKNDEFVDVNLFYNKVTLQVLANNATTCPKNVKPITTITRLLKY